ncbi:MAG: barstar family protein [Lachnospiraceae bacterium]|nr:barstar family protein [Lachnospiraceae bacterium]
METLVLNLALMDSISDVHRMLKDNPEFPSYYGNNLDALFDVLSTWSKPLTIELVMDEEIKWRRLMRVLQDVCEENPKIHCQIHLLNENT